MKTMKTILSVLLSVVLAASMLCVGVSAEEVTVTAITTDDLTLYQYGDGDWQSIQNEDGTYTTHVWFRYDITPKTYTVTFSDGSTFTGAPYEIYKQTGDWAVIEDEQSIDNQWERGEYDVTFTFGELTSSYTVTIIEAPVVSVTAEDVTVRQYVDGEYSMNDEFLYTLDPFITVTFTDGTVVSGTRREIRDQTGYLPNLCSMQGDTELSIGDHTASVLYMGVRADFTATVVDVVESIELVQAPTRTTDIPYGAYFDLSGGVLRVHFADGTYEDIALDMTHPSPTYASEVLGGDYESEITPSRATASGEQEVMLRFLGETVSYTASVLDVPEQLTLTANEDHSLALTFGYEGEAITLNITDFTFLNGSGMGSSADIEASGWLYTDTAMFYATLIRNGDTREVSVALGNAYMDGGVYAVSNSITDAVWFIEHNGMYLCGDFNNDGEANTADVRNMLSEIAKFPHYTNQQQLVADLNNNGTVDTTDARLMLKRLLT